VNWTMVLGSAMAAGTLWLGPSVDASTVTVFAASSVSTALEELRVAYEQGTGRRVTLSLAASSTLARQIEAGASAGVFISADEEWMDYLAARRLLVAGSRVPLLRNRLVLIAPADSTIEIRIAPGFPLGRLLGNGRLATGDPDHVPVGRYAREALTQLGVWSEVEHRLVGADSARAALALVERGEVPLGIVYATDVRMSRMTRVVGELPESTHRPIVYPMALLVGQDSAAARQFYAFVRGEQAAGTFRRHGFLVPR
jgi:molybdate transport system substrate-binding protein